MPIFSPLQNISLANSQLLDAGSTNANLDWENLYLYGSWSADKIYATGVGTDWSVIGNQELVTKEAVNAVTLDSVMFRPNNVEGMNTAGSGTEWPLTTVFNTHTPFGGNLGSAVTCTATADVRGGLVIPAHWPQGGTIRVTAYYGLNNVVAATGQFTFRMRLMYNATPGESFTSTVSNVASSQVNTSQTFSEVGAAGNAANAWVGGFYWTASNTAGEAFTDSRLFTLPATGSRYMRVVEVGRAGFDSTDTAAATIYFLGAVMELIARP
jgi:hypothetical protein